MMDEARPSEKILVAFDFDHTMIEDNSDLYVRRLAPNGKIPQEIKDKYHENNWTEYMAAIFRYLHDNGITESQILDCVREIPFVEGMKELLEYLKDQSYEVIIISDANSVFIDSLLGTISCDFIKVYTNPAAFGADGCLTLDYYHYQDWCDLSTVNLCKGHILQEHIKARGVEGVHYSVVAFVGDGSNDLCPCLRLKHPDVAFVRKGFSLEKKVKRMGNGGLHCQVCYWKTGSEILDKLQTLSNSSETKNN